MTNQTTIRGKDFKFNGRPIWIMAAHNNWEPKTFDILDKYIISGKTFIDIGAWCGILSLYAEKLGAKVYSIEPDPVAFEELKENAKLNSSNIKRFALAIYDDNGLAEMNSMTYDGFGNSESSLVDRGKIRQKAFVQCTTLFSFIKDYKIKTEDICLIKIDIEGGEILLLKQAKEFLQKYKPTLYISFHPAWFPDYKKNVRDIIDTLFPIYECGYSEAEFRTALTTISEHSFLFEKR